MRRVRLVGVLVAAMAAALVPAAAQAGETPGTGGKIVLVDADLTDDPTVNRIFVSEVNGTGRTQLATDFTDARDPAWSPDGTKIAFVGTRAGETGARLYVMDADGTDVEKVFDRSGVDDPTWSPDGRKIAYERNQVLEVVDLATDAVTELVPFAFLPNDPHWSPAGDLIAFSGEQGGRDIFVVPAAGGTPRRLTNGLGARNPQWSPDARRIAFDASAGGFSGDVVIADDDGSNPRLVTDGLEPTWSPDGSKLALRRFGPIGTSFDGQVVTVRLDGTGIAAVTNQPTTQITPDWQHSGHPVAIDDGPFWFDRGRVSVVGAPGLLGNDFDPDADPITANRVTGASRAVVTVSPIGAFSYSHGGGPGTFDTFTYEATDGPLDSLPATARVIVTDPAGTPDTVGLVNPRSGMWHLAGEKGTEVAFFYGNPGDVPFMGDWDCDGDDTPGLYRQSDGFVYLRNSNTQGVADIRFFFGNPGDLPLAGDWDGDGCDTVSIFRPSLSQVFVINELGANDGGLGAAEFDFVFGNPGDKPFTGDFDGDGIDEVGLHRESTGLVYFRFTLTQGIADREFIFGDPGDRFVAGDWTANGEATAGLFRPSTKQFFLRDSNTAGVADIVFPYGRTPWLPVSGTFGIG